MFSVVRHQSSKVPIKLWNKYVGNLEDQAWKQIQGISSLPILHPKGIAVLPDAHLGKGACVGTCIPTIKAVIPAAVGVDIGCGMIAAKTSLNSSQLPDSLRQIRLAIEGAVPHGRTHSGGKNDKGSWNNNSIPSENIQLWKNHLEPGFVQICQKYPSMAKSNSIIHLGTLGTGNHFIELCLDESDRVWIMLHSGSRGIGNRIGTFFIEAAKKEMGRLHGLPDSNLAYLREGSRYFDDYVYAVSWAQEYARLNRDCMMRQVIQAIKTSRQLPDFSVETNVISCHHNYVNIEMHDGIQTYVQRKGAISAAKGQYGIIPGSMGTRSYIVKGKGSVDSFNTASHGAGRQYSRTEAKKRFTIKDHIDSVKGVECRLDKDVIDETPRAYKNIDDVMRSQEDLVDIVHVLKQVLCVKG